MGRVVTPIIKEEVQLKKDFITSILKGEYVLVIGPEDFLNPEQCNGFSNSFSYISSEYEKTLRGQDKKIVFNVHKKVSDLLDDKEKRNWIYKIDEISPDLVRLLRTKLFRVVLTTTFDSYLETLFEDIWGKGNWRVRTVNDASDVNNFISFNEYGEIPPTLFYLFGKADGIQKFALSDNDNISFVRTWMRCDDRMPNSIINYLRSKKILSLGCRFDDWLFRFFWYMLRQDGNQLSGDVAMSLNPSQSQSDDSLMKYFEENNIIFRDKPAKFISELVRNLENPDLQLYSMDYANKLRAGGIFLSYASEDFAIVRQIFDTLIAEGYAVWFDNNALLGGDPYDKRISDAISQCKIFIPIFSKQTKKDLLNGNERYYNGVEWKAISDNKNAKVVGVSLHGFDPRTCESLLPAQFQKKTILNWSEISKETFLSQIKEIWSRNEK